MKREKKSWNVIEKGIMAGGGRKDLTGFYDFEE